MRRTGPLRRSFDDSGDIEVHVEFLNTNDEDHVITLTVNNIDNCPVTEIFSQEITVRAGCWNVGSGSVPASVLHWEVQIHGADDVLATVYHFRSDSSRDDSLTYRETELVGHDD